MKEIYSCSTSIYFFLAAFSADFVTVNNKLENGGSTDDYDTTLATLFGLVDGFDDADSNGLPHVTDGETTERRVLVVGLNTLVATSDS